MADNRKNTPASELKSLKDIFNYLYEKIKPLGEDFLDNDRFSNITPEFVYRWGVKDLPELSALVIDRQTTLDVLYSYAFYDHELFRSGDTKDSAESVERE